VIALLVRLVRLFPEAFRTRFAAEIGAQIERDYRRARSRGRLAAVWFTLATAADLARAAFAERRRPVWPARRSSHDKERDMRSIGNEWATDLRRAARALRRAPGFAAVAAITLGLAIGANAGMFSVVDAVLLHPLPFADVDRLVHIAASAPGSDFPPEFGVAREFYVQYKELSHLLEDVAVVNSFTNTLRVGDRVERVRMSWPTNSLFSTLGARPILGRLPVAADEDHVAVISYALWQSWFAGDPAVIGRACDVGGESRTVVGVMGPEFRFPDDGTLLWISNEIRAEGIVPGRFGSPLVGRMKPGVTPEALATELTALARRLPERFGGSPNYARLMEKHRAVVRPLAEEMLGAVARPLWVLLGAVAIVLLIAGSNVANLFLVRAEGRQRDLAVRRAIGAGRGQLVRLQMAEAIVVAGLAAALAIGFAALLLPVILHAAPSGIPRLDRVGLGPRTLLFTLAAALASAVVCGAVPAWRASAPDLSRLRDGGRGTTHRRRWARNLLVAGQTALALVLLIGSALLVRSLQALRDVDPGYETRELFTFQIAPERPQLADGPSFARFDLDFLARLAKLPGVDSVGLVENVPLDESTSSDHFYAEGGGGASAGGTMIHYTFTAGDYFRTMGIELVAGRAFTLEDQLTNHGNVILSRSAASLLWPGQDPIGRRLRSQEEKEWTTVVGVVEDVRQDSFREPPEPLAYLPLVGPTPGSWTVSSPAYVLKTARAESIAPEVRALVREVAPEAPMYRVYTMAGLASRSLVDLSFTMLTLAIAAALALILGAVGLYGVLSYVVAERTREIGVRMALGAQARQVRRMVVADGARVVCAGVAVGVLAALAATRALGGLLYGVEAVDLRTFAAMSAAMVAVGLLASYLPARRASRVDPLVSLRGD
jgi:predicted permease